MQIDRNSPPAPGASSVPHLLCANHSCRPDPVWTAPETEHPPSFPNPPLGAPLNLCRRPSSLGSLPDTFTEMDCMDPMTGLPMSYTEMDGQHSRRHSRRSYGSPPGSPYRQRLARDVSLSSPPRSPITGKPCSTSTFEPHSPSLSPEPGPRYAPSPYLSSVAMLRKAHHNRNLGVAHPTSNVPTLPPRMEAGGP